jgi:hypothetical protein
LINDEIDRDVLERRYELLTEEFGVPLAHCVLVLEDKSVDPKLIPGLLNVRFGIHANALAY